VVEFHDRIRDIPHIWLESGGEQVFENTPFHAVSEMLSHWLELQDAASYQASALTAVHYAPWVSRVVADTHLSLPNHAQPPTSIRNGPYDMGHQSG